MNKYFGTNMMSLKTYWYMYGTELTRCAWLKSHWFIHSHLTSTTAVTIHSLTHSILFISQFLLYLFWGLLVWPFNFGAGGPSSWSRSIIIWNTVTDLSYSTPTYWMDAMQFLHALCFPCHSTRISIIITAIYPQPISFCQNN